MGSDQNFVKHGTFYGPGGNNVGPGSEGVTMAGDNCQRHAFFLWLLMDLKLNYEKAI